MRQGKIIARQVKGHWYRILIHYDIYGRRRQKSLGPIDEETARDLRERGGEEIDGTDVNRLLQGRPPRNIGREKSDETFREGEEVPEAHSEAQDGGDADQGQQRKTNETSRQEKECKIEDIRRAFHEIASALSALVRYDFQRVGELADLKYHLDRCKRTFNRLYPLPIETFTKR